MKEDEFEQSFSDVFFVLTKMALISSAAVDFPPSPRDTKGKGKLASQCCFRVAAGTQDAGLWGHDTLYQDWCAERFS